MKHVHAISRVQGRGRGGSSQNKQVVGTTSATVNNPVVPAGSGRAYAMRAREEHDAADVIAGMFSLFTIPMLTLIDPGSTNSFICTRRMLDNMLCCESLAYDIYVMSPLGHDVVLLPKFDADLLSLNVHEFDISLGMDWLKNIKL